MVKRLVVTGTRDASFEDIPVFIAAIRRWISRNGRPTHVVCGGNNPEKTLGADLIGAHLPTGSLSCGTNGPLGARTP